MFVNFDDISCVIVELILLNSWISLEIHLLHEGVVVVAR